jgi:L-alanine-DL-glutamate epimerase-like enolase superfamily enzyme
MYCAFVLEPTGDNIDLLAKNMNENVEGFTAYKTCPIEAMQMIEQPDVLHSICDNIIRLRDKVDKDIDLAFDFHGRCTPAMVCCLESLIVLNEDYFLVSPFNLYA